MRDRPFYVWTFKFFDVIKQQWKHCNSTNWKELENYRQLLLKEPRYKNIGDLYQRDIAHANVY